MKNCTLLIILKKKFPKNRQKKDKVIGIKRDLHNVLPRHSLITIHKPSTRPAPDYGVTIFDQIKNVFFL